MVGTSNAHTGGKKDPYRLKVKNQGSNLWSNVAWIRLILNKQHYHFTAWKVLYTWIRPRKTLSMDCSYRHGLPPITLAVGFDYVVLCNSNFAQHVLNWAWLSVPKLVEIISLFISLQTAESVSNWQPSPEILCLCPSQKCV